MGTKFDEFQKIDYAIRKVLNKRQLSTNISAVKLKKKYQRIYSQLMQLQNECKVRGYSAFMLTLSTYHTKSNKVESTYRMLNNAKNKLLRNKVFRRLKQDLDSQFLVTVLEIPFSDLQGWHCHYHLLLITKYNLTELGAIVYEKELTQVWSELLHDEGIGNNRKINEWLLSYGLKLQTNFKHFGYLVQRKKIIENRKNSFNNFSSLNLARLSCINEAYAKKFNEYANFVKNKELISFSSTSFLGINFVGKSDTSLMEPPTIDVSKINTSIYNEVENKSAWSPSLHFVFSKVMRHYRISWKSFRVELSDFVFWLCRYSNIDVWKVKDFIKYYDEDCFKPKKIPVTVDNPAYDLIIKFVSSFKQFLNSLRVAKRRRSPEYFDFVGRRS